MGDDVILIGHRLPLPVLLLDVLLQIEARLLRNVVLLEKRLKHKQRSRSHYSKIRTFYLTEKNNNKPQLLLEYFA